MADKVTPVEVGEKYTLSTSKGKQELEVQESCGNKHGHWVCVTHDRRFENQMMKDTHINDGKEHRLAWACPEHGLEKP